MRSSYQIVPGTEIGVTAYTQKAVHRLRPNEKFLQATLRNVKSGNRRVEENMMWRQRRAELAGHDARHPDSDDSPHASKHIRMADAHSVQDTAYTDAAVMRLLSSKPVRGRGGVGSRVEETGPYLPAEADTGRENNEAAASNGRTVGPDCPDWIRQVSGNSEALTAVATSQTMASRASLHMSTKTHNMPVQSAIAKKPKKSKKTKKHRKKHKHKHKSEA